MPISQSWKAALDDHSVVPDCACSFPARTSGIETNSLEQHGHTQAQTAESDLATYRHEVFLKVGMVALAVSRVIN